MPSFSDGTLTLIYGSSRYLDGAAKKADGTPQPLTGWTLTFALKRSFLDADGAAVMLKSTPLATVTITDAVNGLYTVLIQPSDWSGIANRGQRFYGSVVGKDPLNAVFPLWEGIIHVDPTGVLTP